MRKLAVSVATVAFLMMSAQADAGLFDGLAFELWEILQQRSADISLVSEVFKQPLADSINDFFWELLGKSFQKNKTNNITTNFIAIFENAKNSNGSGNVSIRQKAGNLLPIVASDDELDWLLKELEQEPVPFVRRGIIVGLAIHKDRRDLIENHLTQLRDNENARKVQIGFTRIYRGDQIFTGKWEDDGTETCNNSMRKIIEIICNQGNSSERLLHLGILGILIEDGRGKRWLMSHESARTHLREILEKPVSECGDVFVTESISVINMLDDIDRESATR